MLEIIREEEQMQFEIEANLSLLHSYQLTISDIVECNIDQLNLLRQNKAISEKTYIRIIVAKFRDNLATLVFENNDLDCLNILNNYINKFGHYLRIILAANHLDTNIIENLATWGRFNSLELLHKNKIINTDELGIAFQIAEKNNHYPSPR